MNPNREEALFAAALEQPSSERAAFLNGACLGDDALRRHIEALLAAHDATLNPLATQAEAARPTIKLDLADAPDEAVGQTLGRYKLLERVGEGGCGVVYVAEQTEPVRRRVALKVIKLGMDTKQVVARFEAERQALAMMDHPNIAKVLDAGTTDLGRPFFVMELVRGIKITDYCDQANLNTQSRLELFIKVCQAIQHAHQKGIIHRDIKPSNILVTLHDGVPVPKVIDFGIAKATEGRLTDNTVYTQLHQFIGTPAYMSPEQAEMSGLDIDTRSDIYSLGVLLYELLAGSTPFDPKDLMASGIDAMRKTIREKEPQRPSTRFATLGADQLTTTAKRRSADTSKLLHQLKGDLDWIVMKCLEKDRQRRYETANGLAADITRHLTNEPVIARPPSAAYKFQKTYRRNKGVFAAGAAVAVALVFGLGLSLWQAVRASREARRAQQAETEAQRRLTEAEAISKFMTEVFQSPDPARDGRTITVAETLDTAAKKLETDLANQPDRQAHLRTTMADTYFNMGLYQEAAPLYEKSLAYQRSILGPEHTNTIDLIASLAGCLDWFGRPEQGLQLRKQVLALRGKVLGAEHPATIRARMTLAASLRTLGLQSEAFALNQETFDICRQLFGPADPQTLQAMNNLATSHGDRNQSEDAIRLLEEALRLLPKAQSYDEFHLVLRLNLADQLNEAKRYDESILVGRSAHSASSQHLGPTHPYTIAAASNLGRAYRGAHRLGEAVEILAGAFELARKHVPPKHPVFRETITNLIACYEELNRKPEAEALQREFAELNAKSERPASGFPPPTVVAPAQPLAPKP